MLASTHTTRDREIQRREKDLYDGRCPGLRACRCSSRKPVTASLAERPDLQTTLGKQNQQADRGAKATGTSKVGSHRITLDEESFAGWTGTPKRAWRRETLGSSIVSVQSRKTSAGTDDRVEARSSRRDLVGNDRTRVHEISSVVDGSCRWCASRVCKGSRGPEQTLALRGIRSWSTPHRRIERQNGATRTWRFPKQESDTFAIGGSKGSQRSTRQ